MKHTGKFAFRWNSSLCPPRLSAVSGEEQVCPDPEAGGYLFLPSGGTFICPCTEI